MALTITVVDGTADFRVKHPVTGELNGHFENRPSYTFGDDIDSVRIGRSHQHCDVVLPPPDLLMVGKQHCELRRVAGEYLLQLNTKHAVYLDGKRADFEEVLDGQSKLQIGPGGPQLEVTHKDSNDNDLGRTMIYSRPNQPLQQKVRNVKMFALASLAGVCVVAAAVSLLLFRSGRGQLKQYLSKTVPSVLVVIQRTSGKEGVAIEGIATAWVLDRENGILATNAHVGAEILNRDSNISYFARSNGDDPKDFPIVNCTLHPGYAEFQLYCQLAGFGNTFHESGSCDISLLQVDNKNELPPDLKIASKETLDRLRQGGDVGYEGYPAQDMIPSNPAHPKPSEHTGEIVRMQTVFFSGDSDMPEELIIHSLDGAGGASGSPIIDGSGSVVALFSGGHKQNVRENFGQRADLVKEMWDEGAVSAKITEAAQTLRRQKWDTMLKRLNKPGFVAGFEKAAGHLRDNWLDDNRQKNFETVIQPNPDTIYRLEKSEEQQPVVFTEVELPVKGAGKYLLVAVSNREIGAAIAQPSKCSNCNKPEIGVAFEITGVEKSVSVKLTAQRTKIPPVATLALYKLPSK